MAKKAPVSKKSVKSDAVSKKKAAVSPEKHTQKPVEAPQKKPITVSEIVDATVATMAGLAKPTQKPVEVPPYGYAMDPEPTPTPAIKRKESPFEHKMCELRERFKGDAMNSDRAIYCNLHLRTIELLEEILDELRSHH